MPLDFFYRYFVEPIELGYGYNPVNTLAYALLFVSLTYLLFVFLKKSGIKTDKRFVLAVAPWIIFGILLRILEDMGIISGYLFVTPNIWLLFVFLINSLLVASKLIEKKYKIPYYKIMFISGVMFSGPLLGFFNIQNALGLWYVLLWLVPWLIVLKMVKWPVKIKLLPRSTSLMRLQLLFPFSISIISSSMFCLGLLLS